MIPGVNVALGAGLGGGLGSLISGGGLKGALKQGLLSGATAGLLSPGGFTGALNSAGFGNAAYNIAEGGGGLLGSVVRGADIIGGALRSGIAKIGAGSLLPGTSSNAATSFLPDPTATAGAATAGRNALGGALNSVFSGIQGTQAYKEMQKAQMAANRQALSSLTPYAESGNAANERLRLLLGLGGDASDPSFGQFARQFSMDDFTADPGYQFRLEQGENALNRSLGARGQLFSGAALKAAQEYGQGMADQTYNDAYMRWLQQNQNQYNQLSGLSTAGQNAATGMADLYGQQGDIAANSIMGRTNVLNQAMANVLGAPYSAIRGAQTGAYDPNDPNDPNNPNRLY